MYALILQSYFTDTEQSRDYSIATEGSKKYGLIHHT